MHWAETQSVWAGSSAMRPGCTDVWPAACWAQNRPWPSCSRGPRPGASACSATTTGALRPAAAGPFLPCRWRGAARRPREGCGRCGRPILRRGGAENFAEMAGHGGAPAEERGNGVGARQQARRPELGGVSFAAPRGCRGTCSMGRERSERGCRRAPPTREAGEGGGALTGGRTPTSGGRIGH
jgi:hypothetical protein